MIATIKIMPIISPINQAMKDQCMEFTKMPHKMDKTMTIALKNMMAAFIKYLLVVVNPIIAGFQCLVNKFFRGSKLNHKCITIDRMNMRLVSLNQDRFRDKWRVFRVSFYPSAMALSGELSR